MLNAIYPTAIVLILLGLCDRWLHDNPYVYPCTVGAVSVVSVVYALDNVLPLGAVSRLFHHLPFYSSGMGWVTVAVVITAVAVALPKLPLPRFAVKES